jgi:hypothetical protein
MNTVANIKSAAGGLVVSNPGILGGVPVFEGTRLPVRTLFDYLADGLLSITFSIPSMESLARRLNVSFNTDLNELRRN